MATQITKDELFDSVENLRKCIDTNNDSHYNHLTNVQAIVIQFKKELLRLTRAVELICVGGVLLAVIVILHLVGWI